MQLFFLLTSTSLSLATKNWSKYTGVSSKTMSKQKPASKEACLLTGRIYPLVAFKLSTKVLTENLAFLEPLLHS
jgi:hypothetical protein